MNRIALLPSAYSIYKDINSDNNIYSHTRRKGSSNLKKLLRNHSYDHVIIVIKSTIL